VEAVGGGGEGGRVRGVLLISYDLRGKERCGGKKNAGYRDGVKSQTQWNPARTLLSL